MEWSPVAGKRKHRSPVTNGRWTSIHAKLNCGYPDRSNRRAKDERAERKVPDGVLARTEHRPPAVQREGVIAIGATAVGALALGAVAVGALVIGKMAIGQLALGRAKVRRGQADDLEIARLTIRELTIERLR